MAFLTTFLPSPVNRGASPSHKSRLPMLQRPQTVVAFPKVPLVRQTINSFFFSRQPPERPFHFTALSLWVHPKRESRTVTHSCVFHSQSAVPDLIAVEPTKPNLHLGSSRKSRKLILNQCCPGGNDVPGANPSGSQREPRWGSRPGMIREFTAGPERDKQPSTPTGDSELPGCLRCTFRRTAGG